MTSSSNVTVHETLAAFVGLGSSRVIDTTSGGTASFTTVTALLAALCAVQLRKTAVTVHVYVPFGTAVSLHDVVEISEEGVVEQAATTVEPSSRVT